MVLKKFKAFLKAQNQARAKGKIKGRIKTKLVFFDGFSGNKKSVVRNLTPAELKQAKADSKAKKFGMISATRVNKTKK